MKWARDMDFTGERFVPTLDGQIKYEHLHRYALAMDFAAGRSVLDVASGEGYGAALLARVAASVVGVDISPESVEHARRSYFQRNLEFLAGGCEALPLADASVDVVTSFETIEHHDKHEEMMAEIKRVLRPGGLLVISSPNRQIYSDEPGYKNPFHVKELYYDEFLELLRRHFKHIHIYGQRLAAGSFIYELESTDARHFKSYSDGVEHLTSRVASLPSPVYFIAVCSDEEIADPHAVNSLYLDGADDLWKLAEEARSIYEAQLRRQEEELAQARAGYESQISRQAEELARERAGYESKIENITDEHARARATYESRLENLADEHARERATYESRLEELSETLVRERAGHEARLAEKDAALSAAISAARKDLSRKDDELARAQMKYAEELASAEAAHAAQRAAHAAQLKRYEETLSAAQARLAQQDAVLSVLQSKLAAAQAHLVRNEDVLTWIQSSRSWHMATRLRHLLDFKQDQHRLSRGLRRRLRLPPQKSLFEGFIDSPAYGGEATGELELVGWAFSTAAPVTLVEAFLDDFYLGRLNYGVERPDVSAAYPSQAPAACGFHERVALLAFMAGPRNLTVRVYDGGGNVHRFTQPVVVKQTHAPTPVAAHLPHASDEAAGRSDDGAGALAAHDAAAETPAASASATAEPAFDTVLCAQLEELIAEFRSRTGRDAPSILDWNVGINLSEMFPHLAIFSPPAFGGLDGLPYLDESIDLVMLSSDETAHVAEARRVAAAALVHVQRGASPSGEGKVALQTQWKCEAKEPALASVSVIIPVFNKVAFTKDCLEQLQATLPRNFKGEIIVVDDASTDETPSVLERFARADARLKVLRNEHNLGFIGSCNRGAEEAGGEVLVFLNNDTLPQPGWLPPLLRVLGEREQAGAVGGKLIYPDGTLQEAGGCIFADGTGCNFGKHDARPNAPLYSFLREVDYCSGALLATPRALFRRLGGFDTHFAPAYYEDTDYCFRLREEGFRVYYQPQSVIVHFEGVTSGTDTASGVKRYQEINRAKFLDRWRHVLKRHPAAPDKFDFATLHALSARGGSGERDEDR